MLYSPQTNNYLKHVVLHIRKVGGYKICVTEQSMTWISVGYDRNVTPQFLLIFFLQKGIDSLCDMIDLVGWEKVFATTDHKATLCSLFYKVNFCGTVFAFV